jgi:hypothetical protein
VYLFLYSIFYFVTTLEIEQFVSGLLSLYIFSSFPSLLLLSLANTFILQSFLTAGASAVYLFLYSIFYFVTTLEIEQSSTSLSLSLPNPHLLPLRYPR